MSGHAWRTLPIALILFALFMGATGKSSAQNAYTATLSSPDISDFPHITAFLDVHNPQGEFVHGLTPQDVDVLENGVQITSSELDDLKPGVQFVIAISPGQSFTIRDSMGISRYEYFLRGFLAGSWIHQPSEEDDFSLLTFNGPQSIHLSTPLSIYSSLKNYTPNDPDVTPNLEVLASALQVASDPTSRPGMERAILFITPPLGSEVSMGLQSIIASANQQHVRIFVWLLAAPEVINLPEIDQLRSLAEQTQGAFFAFSHDEVIPDLETLIEPLRHVYRLRYASQVNTAGTQELYAQVTIGTDVITSTAQSFQLDLQAPAPTILNPPAVIARKYSTQLITNTTDINNELLPAEQVLSIQVAYPDGHERDIAMTRLYVDGAVVAENISSPFTRFTWDLRPYTQEDTHTLSVEVTDSLGLVGKSADVPVKITVPSNTQGVIISVSQKRPLIIGATVVVSASILVLVLILGGRIHPKPHPGQVIQPAGASEKTHPIGRREKIRQRKDPVTQPVQINRSPPSRVKAFILRWKALVPRVKSKSEPKRSALAYLIPLVGFDDPTIPATLQISTDEVVLGSDPDQASLVITDPSIDAVHARINHADKAFKIIDLGSVADTWVNFEQLPKGGKYLEDMDIIHLGRIGFRIKLSSPAGQRKIVVKLSDQNQ
jgi:hypothetical protein